MHLCTVVVVLLGNLALGEKQFSRCDVEKNSSESASTIGGEILLQSKTRMAKDISYPTPGLDVGSLIQAAGQVDDAVVDSEGRNLEGCTFWSGGNLLDQLAVEHKLRTLNGCMSDCNDCCKELKKGADFRKEVYEKGKIKNSELLTYEYFEGVFEVTEQPPPEPKPFWTEMSLQFARTCSSTVNYMFGLPFAVDNNVKMDKLKERLKKWNIFLNTELPELVRVHEKTGVKINLYQTHLFTAMTNKGVDTIMEDRKKSATKVEEELKEATAWVWQQKPVEIHVTHSNLEEIKTDIVDKYEKYLNSWHGECDAKYCQRFWNFFKHYAPDASDIKGGGKRVLMDMGAVQQWVHQLR